MTYAWQNPAQHRKRLPHDAVRETIGVVVKGCCRRLPVRIGVGAYTGRHALNLVVVGPQALRHVVGWLVGRRCTGVTSAAGVARNCWLLRLCCCTTPGRDLARQHPPRTHGRTQPRRAALPLALLEGQGARRGWGATRRSQNHWSWENRKTWLVAFSPQQTTEVRKYGQSSPNKRKHRRFLEMHRAQAA
jgi:hypothetical protein